MVESVIFNKRGGFVRQIKCPTFWGKEGNSCYPVAYIKKPQNISEEDFEKVLDLIEKTFKEKNL
jgi:hypothetical protein